MIDIIVAVIGLLGVVYAARLAAGARSAVREVHAEVKTNHGKTAGQYLEMVEQVRDGQDALFTLLADHTQQDAEQFAELKKRIDDIAA